MNNQESSKIKPGDLLKSPRSKRIYLVLEVIYVWKEERIRKPSYALVYCLHSKETDRIDLSFSFYKAINQNWVICE